jgi:hypothetical protein
MTLQMIAMASANHGLSELTSGIRRDEGEFWGFSEKHCQMMLRKSLCSITGLIRIKWATVGVLYAKQCPAPVRV